MPGWYTPDGRKFCTDSKRCSRGLSRFQLWRAVALHGGRGGGIWQTIVASPWLWREQQCVRTEARSSVCTGYYTISTQADISLCVLLASARQEGTNACAEGQLQSASWVARVSLSWLGTETRIQSQLRRRVVRRLAVVRQPANRERQTQLREGHPRYRAGTL